MEYNNKSPSSLVSSTATFSLLAATLAVVLAVGWFIFGIVTDSIDAKLIVLDSYDPGKAKIWKIQYAKEALRGWAIPGLIFLSVVLILGKGMARSARYAWQHLQKSGAKKGENNRFDNVQN